MTEESLSIDAMFAKITAAEQELSNGNFGDVLELVTPVFELERLYRRARVLKAKALSELGDKTGAARIYAAILRSDPDDEETQELFAWTRHEAGFYAEAETLWAKLRLTQPDNDSGWFGGGGALIGLERFDEAESLLEEGFRRFPDAYHIYETYARCAMERGAHEEGLSRWAKLRAMNPENPNGFVEPAWFHIGAGRFDEAEKALDQAPEDIKQKLSWIAARAHIAEQRHDLQAALSLWDKAITAYSGSIEARTGAFDVLVDLGRLEDAQNVLLPAVRRYPDSLDIGRRFAWLAHYKNDWGEAASRWAKLRVKFDDEPIGYSGGIASLRAMGCYAEAEALGTEGLDRFPEDFELLLEHAQIATTRGEWAEAIERFQKLRSLHAFEPNTYPPFVTALTQAERWDEADTIIREAQDRLGHSIELSCAFAAVAAEKKDWAEAESRWRATVSAFPNLLQAHLGLATALREAGNIEASEQALNEARSLFKGSLEIEIGFANALSIKRNWNRALPLWSELKQKYPQHSGVRAGIREALWQARQDLNLLPPEDRFEIPENLLQKDMDLAANAAEMHDLFMRFESIGDSCEFGIVQRHFGAEPLSLLRWTSTNPDMLVTALNDNLQGIGDPDFTIVSIVDGEYTTRDSRYFMFAHTFTPATAVPQAKFFDQQCKRLQYLRNKLLDDLAVPEKVFVYKSDHGLDGQQIEALFEALRRYGGNPTLLCVKLAEEDHPSESLERIRDGLFIGYIDRFSTVDTNVAGWASICKHVLERTKAMAQPQ